MRKLYLFTLIIALSVTISNAQIAINKDGTSADTTTMLDVKSTNKGILIPRVALTGTNDITTIHSATTSLLVYNTATTSAAGTAVAPGFYYWNGNAWVQVATTNLIVNVPEVVDMKGLYSAATTYAQNDLVSTGTNKDIFFYSLKPGNIGNTPTSSPQAWQAVEVEQLKQIHKSMPLPAPALSSLVSFLLPGTNTAGGRIQYTIRATGPSGQLLTEQGIVQFACTASSITCTIEPTESLSLGTLNVASSPGFFTGGQPGVSIYDNLPFTAVLHDVYFRISLTAGQLVSGTYTKIRMRLE